MVDEKDVELEECGCCGMYHRPAYTGECRNDAERFPWSHMTRAEIAEWQARPSARRSARAWGPR